MSVAEGDTRSDIISGFLKQYYGGTPYIPNVVMLQEEIEDAQIISEWLGSMKKRKVSVVTPKKGTKEKRQRIIHQDVRSRHVAFLSVIHSLLRRELLFSE